MFLRPMYECYYWNIRTSISIHTVSCAAVGQWISYIVKPTSVTYSRQFGVRVSRLTFVPISSVEFGRWRSKGVKQALRLYPRDYLVSISCLFYSFNNEIFVDLLNMSMKIISRLGG